MITIKLMMHKTAISSKETDLSNPSIAFLESFIINIKRGIITGKLNIAIKVPLLLALDAIADIMVKTVEKLILPRSTVIKYNPLSPTSF